MCHEQIFTSNATDMPHMPIISCPHETTVSVYIPHMNAMKSIMSPGALIYYNFSLLTYALE